MIFFLKKLLSSFSFLNNKKRMWNLCKADVCMYAYVVLKCIKDDMGLSIECDNVYKEEKIKLFFRDGIGVKIRSIDMSDSIIDSVEIIETVEKHQSTGIFIHLGDSDFKKELFLNDHDSHEYHHFAIITGDDRIDVIAKNEFMIERL